MLNEIEISKLIENGENSFVEFKQDSASNRNLAEEIIAFTNHKGGFLFLGISDDRQPVGLTRQDNEERIMNICDDLIFPTVYPSYFETTVSDTKIAVIEIEVGSNKPYCIPKGPERKFNPDEIYIRQGSKTRKLRNRDELQRLFQDSANIHYEIIPVAYSTLDDIDLHKAASFLKNNLKSVSIANDIQIVLKNLELIVEVQKAMERNFKPTIAGLLLFGKNRIKQLLPQSGITCIQVDGNDITDQKANHKFFTRDLFMNFDDAWNFLKNDNKHAFTIVGKNRIDKYDYPNEVFRELLANALIHRDYAIAGSEIFVWVFENRVEIKSPGRIPNTISIEKMKYGAKYHRNPVLAQFFAYAGIVEMLGQGIPMVNYWLKENGNPELLIEEKAEEVVVTVFKEQA